jgi:hypothetical protein
MNVKQRAIEATVPSTDLSNPATVLALRAVAEQAIDNYVKELYGEYGELTREELQSLLPLIPVVPDTDPGWAGTTRNYNYLRRRFKAMLDNLW